MYQSDLGISYDRLGELTALRGQTSEAIELVRKGLIVRQNLVVRDKENVIYQYDLAESYHRLAQLVDPSDPAESTRLKRLAHDAESKATEVARTYEVTTDIADLSPERILNMTFRRSRKGRRYASAEVDTFLYSAAQDLTIRLDELSGASGRKRPGTLSVRLLLDDIRLVQFDEVTRGNAYVKEDVDKFLDQLWARFEGIDRQLDDLGVKVASSEHPPEAIDHLNQHTGSALTTQEIREAIFPTVRLREGYDEDEVDELLDIAETDLNIRLTTLSRIETLGVPSSEVITVQLSPDSVRNYQFTTVRLREGYDEERVDIFLDRVEARFRDLDAALQSRGVTVTVVPT
jgi:DivIVA domain-containing protein